MEVAGQSLFQPSACCFPSVQRASRNSCRARPTGTVLLIRSDRSADDLLDAHGGTDIVQVAPASLKFVQGQRRIIGLRLTSNGLFRWYASCCNTPVGNTLSPAVPFVGIIVQAFDNGAQHPDDLFGKPIGAIMGKYAIGDARSDSRGIRLSLMVRAIRMVLGWRLRGQSWPNPFYERDTRAPIYPVGVLSRQQREALRRFCGPHPTARADGHIAH